MKVTVKMAEKMVEKSTKTEKMTKVDKADKTIKVDKAEKTEKTGKQEKLEKAGKVDKMELAERDYTDPKNYVNRELSWLEFDFRILNEARDKSIPLFERLKFLSITASNLDEFFMVRVASLKDQVHARYKKPDIAGLRPEEQLAKIGEKTHEFVNLQYSTYSRSLLPALKQQGLCVVWEHEDLDEKDGEFVDRFFHENVYPVLTPMAVDSSRPFPLIRNKSLNIAASFRRRAMRRRKISNLRWFRFRLCFRASWSCRRVRMESTV